MHVQAAASALLAEMGFTDARENARVLAAVDNDVARAVDRLAGHVTGHVTGV